MRIPTPQEVSNAIHQARNPARERLTEHLGARLRIEDSIVTVLSDREECLVAREVAEAFKAQGWEVSCKAGPAAVTLSISMPPAARR